MPYRNQYFALRHGRSVANETGVIISHPENGISAYGLTETGQRETAAALQPEKIAHFGLHVDTVLCYSSDFLRAIETAQIFCDLNGFAEPIIDTRLRERFFGDLEKGTDADYAIIWEQDELSATHNHAGCESTARVRARLRAFIDDCERDFADRQIVIVSHGDPLQILQTIFHNLRPNQHR
ncbi:MAG: histidine phosphatase family protein, partial [Leptospiraceae bacterium]|nr:histidine phosphatase family protein [Leptospiraceae bacterium]